MTITDRNAGYAGRKLGEAKIAREAKLSYRTLQYWLERYRTSWLAELARKPRIRPRQPLAMAVSNSQYEQAVYCFPSA